MMTTAMVISTGGTTQGIVSYVNRNQHSMTHQHGQMVPVPRGQVGRESNKVEIEPLDELLARTVPRLSHRHHVVLGVKSWTGEGVELGV